MARNRNRSGEAVPRFRPNLEKRLASCPFGAMPPRVVKPLSFTECRELEDEMRDEIEQEAQRQRVKAEIDRLLREEYPHLLRTEYH